MKKNKQHKDIEQPVIVIGNTGGKKHNLLLILAVKLAFTLMLAIGTVMCFTCFYDIPCDIPALILQTVLFVTVFFPLLFLFKKRYVLPVTGAIAAILYYFLHNVINNAVLLFFDYIFIQLEGRLLATEQFVSPDSYAYLPRTQDFTSAMNLAMLIFTGIICLICVLCCYKKFRPIAVILMWCAVYAAAFVAERADYNNYILLIIPAFFGLLAISSSNSVFTQCHSNAAKAGKINVQKGKKRQSRGKKETAIDRALGNLLKFGKNSVCGILAAAIAVSVAVGAQHAFPGMSFINADEIINNVVTIANDIGEYIGTLFSDNPSELFNGYFSSDNFLINNDIELNAPPSTSNTPVLKVTSTAPDSIFLVGDIGYEFTGGSWISIKKKAGANQITDGGYTFSDDFCPDDIFKYYILCKQLNEFNNYTTECHINIEYLKNTDIVFNPFMLTNPAYAYDKENITFYGDTILRVADRKNWVKNFEADVTIPYSDNPIYGAYDDFSKKIILSDVGYDNGKISQILENEKNYQRYVYDTYLSVPESEKENAIRLDKELKNYYEGNSVSYYLYNKSPENYYCYVVALCDYLKSNYTYSLTADNTADENNTVLGNFLFETKQGHCALYASAMVLTLRQQGIPARYITGFSTGTLEKNNQTGYYEKTLTEKDLHAWVEVYFDGIGWLAYDPTGGGSGDSPDNPAETMATTQTTTTTPPATTPPATTTTLTTPVQSTTSSTSEISTPIDTSEDSSGGTGVETPADLDTLIIIFIAVLAVIVIAAAITLFILNVKKKNRMRLVRFKKDEPTAAVKAMYKFIMKLFYKTDITPEETELPIEFALRVDALMKITGMKNNLYEVMTIIEKAEFSDSGITEQERQTVYKYTEMLYNLVLKSAGRIKRVYLKIIL